MDHIYSKDICLEKLIKEARKSLKNNGIYIARNFLREEIYNTCRSEAMEYIKKNIMSKKKLPGALRGDVGAGMRNIIGFDKNKSWHLYRHCAFRWNMPEENLATLINTSINLSRLRNLISGIKETKGEYIEQDDYITYTSLSLYPSNGGFLKKHRDRQPKEKDPGLIHCKLELTHKGKDYDEGGFYITNKDAKEINVSELSNPRDVILFDGTQPHRIRSIEGGELGRIAIFDIPTYVTKSSRISIYAGDGYSLLKKIMIKALSNLSYKPKIIITNLLSFLP